MENNKLYNTRHSLAHIMAAAVLEMFPKANMGVGPVIENGFYYDFLLPRSLTPEDLKKIEKRMRALVQSKIEFVKKDMPLFEAKQYFKQQGQTFKTELISDIEKFGTTEADEIINSDKRQVTSGKGAALKIDKVSLYTSGKFTDLCRGPHVQNTSQIKSDAFKIEKVSGAYWRGDEKNKQLQRIYGVAFETKAELDAYLKMLEEAAKRDHKILGQRLDLFTFSDLVGSGLPLWTPKGTLVRNLLDDFVWELRKEFGYEKVEIPHITKKDLYEISGHWSKFKDDLFKINTREGHLFAMKPMSCPHHTQIYARKMWSYRDLPQRYSNTTMVYRDEQSGELSGLARVRSITQDDAHVFCRLSQAEKELQNIWQIVHKFYGSFGMKLKLRLSLHDPQHLEKFLGDKGKWAQAEEILRKIARANKTEYFEAPGEAAFYGPKLDFMAMDSLGRQWQVATIQLDLNMPESFKLVCINEEGKEERIVMVHAAIMGAIERFWAILIEHYAGEFPLWLAPVQIAILPISKKQNAYAKKVFKELGNANPELRIELDDRDESIGKKIRDASMQKIPYMVILGEKEMKSAKGGPASGGKVAIRTRLGKDLGQMLIKKFLEKIQVEIEKKK